MTVLEQHLQHFISRLQSNNPLLRCTPTQCRVDITTLTGQANPQMILQTLLSNPPQPVEIRDNTDKKENLAKFAKIKTDSDDYFHTTGQSSVYLGFPLIAIPFDNKRYHLAPLFLWKISCKLNAQSITINRVKDEDTQDNNNQVVALEPQLNRILQAWLKHTKNIVLKNVDMEQLCWDNLAAQIHYVLHDWDDCARDVNVNEIQPIPDMAKLKLDQPQVLSSAIIGHIPIRGQSLLEDLDALNQLFKTGTNDSKIIDYFLLPSNHQGEFAPNAQKPAENDQWLVTDYDHSQESVVWNTRQFDLMVLQGPPGTGKSQVIVNLIADALAKQKKVLVVCQKKAALEVLKKRLTAHGLGNLLQLVDDAEKDRMRIIKAIREIDQVPVEIAAQDDRNSISASIQRHEKTIDTYTGFFMDTCGGRRLSHGNLKARLYDLRQQGIHVNDDVLRPLYEECRQNQWLPDDKKGLDELKEEIRHLAKQYKTCRYAENPWVNLINRPSDIQETRDLLLRLLQLAAHLNPQNTCFYPAHLAWLAENSLADSGYCSFLSDANLENHKYFRVLAIKTQDLRQWLIAPYVDGLLASVRSGNGVEQYQRLYKGLDYLNEIIDIRDKTSGSGLLALLLNKATNRMESWVDIVECWTLKLWLAESSRKSDAISANQFIASKRQLPQLIEQKRRQDIQHIASGFNGRLQARNDLEISNLLRIRAAGAVRKTSLRQLYTAGFEHVHQIYPVLLTNPETASRILDLTANLYDLLIIDEASQMFMADALPLLYRSRSAFISGDTQQMPPSDFFMAQVDVEPAEPAANPKRLIPAEGEYCLLEAAEYAVQRGNPNRAMLQVHYRSAFKELMDFSSHAFYEGKLIAATGNKALPACLKTPIELNQIAGESNQGQNHQEAEAVIARIQQIWEHEKSPSLGVITLNVKQKELIDDLLFEKARGDTDFANRLERERNKTIDGEDVGFFVRSVEHVQGDERDIILLSTVYDERAGRHFGAINIEEKGRKRLNVAITRAKSGMIIYTSLNIDSISNDNERTSERYWFWKYLCYARAISSGDAQTARLVLQSLNPDLQGAVTGQVPDSFFEEDVARFLRQHGFHVDYQVGESGFRIDLGVKKAQDDRLYLCGIECDGRLYHSSWTARLNDIWRQKILEGKGWTIIRIWSNDWFDYREKTQKDLLEKLQAS